MRINMTSTLVPLLKSKVDELFLKWLTTDETQKCLQEDLSRILDGVAPAAYETPVISTVVSARPASPPAPPTAILTARSPRSPKPSRKLNKSHSKLSDTQLTNLDVIGRSTAAIPPFYFPKGTPCIKSKQVDAKISRQVESIFKINQQIPMKEFSSVTKVSNFILFFNRDSGKDYGDMYNKFHYVYCHILYAYFSTHSIAKWGSVLKLKPVSYQFPFCKGMC
jgi:hypothetical protein